MNNNIIQTGDDQIDSTCVRIKLKVLKTRFEDSKWIRHCLLNPIRKGKKLGNRKSSEQTSNVSKANSIMPSRAMEQLNTDTSGLESQKMTLCEIINNRLSTYTKVKVNEAMKSRFGKLKALKRINRKLM